MESNISIRTQNLDLVRNGKSLDWHQEQFKNCFSADAQKSAPPLKKKKISKFQSFLILFTDFSISPVVDVIKLFFEEISNSP